MSKELGYLPPGVVLTDEITTNKTSMKSEMQVDPEIDKEQQFEAVVHCECGLIAHLKQKLHPQD